MGKENAKTNLFCGTLIMPHSNKTPSPLKIVQDHFSSVTGPVAESIVDPTLGTVTGVPVDQGKRVND
jgi:hypothetical protein